ncbi:MAG TPA: hypothetical protein VD770_03875 [Coxiellaceae bacterium]|nr:hypothetical protein [Coxiellaceae bacterium]
MGSAEYHLLDLKKWGNRTPSLKQILLGFGLLISLVSLIVRLLLQNHIEHYEELNNKLQQQVTSREKLLSSYEVSTSNKQQQIKFLDLLHLTTQQIPRGISLTQLHMDENSLLLRGTASEAAIIKQYAKSFSKPLSLEDFSFDPSKGQELSFKLRLGY